MENKIRRINIVGGPGSGKSITAVNIRAQLGFRGFNIELVDEAIKDWTYIPRSPKSCDSFYLQACQIQKEELRLLAGVDLVVSDAPLMLQYFYAVWHKNPLQESMLKVAFEFEEMYPSLHIIIERDDEFYDETGRYETLEQAKDMDHVIIKTLRNNNVRFTRFSCREQNKLVEYLLTRLA